MMNVNRLDVRSLIYCIKAVFVDRIECIVYAYAIQAIFSNLGNLLNDFLDFSV